MSECREGVRGGVRACGEVLLIIFFLQWIPMAEAQAPYFSGYSNSQAPQFAQSSYVFNMTTCSTGLFIAAVQANNPSISQIAYSIDNRTGSPQNVAVNYQTGQLNLATSATGKFRVNLRATNFYGAAVVPITIRCGTSNKNGVDIVCFNNFCSNVSKGDDFDFTVGTCYPGAPVGTVSTTGGQAYFLSSGNNNNNFNTGSFGNFNGFSNGGFTNSFNSPSTFNQNSVIGNNMFNLNSNTGALTLSNFINVGTYTVTIVAYKDTGKQVTLTATVELKCDGSTGDNDFNTGLQYICFGGNCYYASTGNFDTSGVSVSSAYSSYLSGATAFGSTGYAFTSQGCTASSYVGTVTALNSYNYGIASGSPYFTISAGGGIYLSSDLAAGNYSIVVSAFGNSGSITTNVSITVSCSVNSTSSSSTSTLTDTSFIINATCLFGNCNFNSTAPVFGSSPYSFSQTNCINGVNGSTIGTVSATGAVVYYIETGPWSNYYDINRTSGVITAYGSVPTGTPVYLTVTATNQNGVPTNVLVQISTSGCTTTTTAATTSTARTSTGSTFSPVFPQTSYSITQVTCAVSTLGAITATNAASYFISSGNNGGFSISSTGVLSATTLQAAGTYSLVVTACTSAGVCVSVPVTVTVSSCVTSTTTAATTGTPVFTQPGGYTMATTTCTAGSAVGAVFATNAITYNINNGSTIFTIDSSGNITLTSATAAGTYNIQVTAFSATGATTTVPVTITVQCAAG